MSFNGKVLITGASGKLGKLVLERLLQKAPAASLAAMVRNPAAVAEFASRGVEVRVADYDNPSLLEAALRGIDRVLLISSNVLGQRVAQHRNVIGAAQRAGAKFLAYTSVLHSDRSVLGLAEDHRRTEAALRESGLPFTILRNGWYTENYTGSISAALAHGAVVGGAGEGRIASAARRDYADAAAAVVLAGPESSQRIYELAGDSAYSLAEFAAELSRQSGRQIVYRNLPEAAYKDVLVGAGLPDFVAGLLSNSDNAASQGALFDDSRQLSRLIGRPTIPLADSIAEALRAAPPPRA